MWVVSPSPEKDEAFLYFAPTPLPSSSTVGSEESSPEKGNTNGGGRMGEEWKEGNGRGYELRHCWGVRPSSFRSVGSLRHFGGGGG